MSDEVLTEVRDGILIVTINRPEAKNAMNRAAAEGIAAAMDRLRAKGSWSNLPAFLLTPTFTYSELRRTYELILGVRLNDSAFRRKIDEMDLIEPLQGQMSKSTARPAQLYRLKDAVVRTLNRRI